MEDFFLGYLGNIKEAIAGQGKTQDHVQTEEGLDVSDVGDMITLPNTVQTWKLRQ